MARHMGRVSRLYRQNPLHEKAITQETLARWLGRTQGAVSRLERAKEAPRDLTVLIRYAQILKIPRRFLWFDSSAQGFPQPLSNQSISSELDVGVKRTHSSARLEPRRGQRLDASSIAEIEAVRRRITDTLGTATITEFTLEEWEQSVLVYGEATRWADGRALISSLVADFTELERQLASRQTTQTQRALCRLVAQLAGLTSLMLTKLGVYGPARSWIRTARLAASEANDSVTRAWVEAQDAYTLFYQGGSPIAAIEAAQFAQSLVRGPAVGKALAAALEARAQGIIGRKDEALRAILNANEALASLSADLRGQSAFGYNEAQLKFHEGNALVNLGDIEAAWISQKRALALYPINDGDRILVHLDRAVGLVRVGSVSEALAYAGEALCDTPQEQRVGIVAGRTRQLLNEIERAGFPLAAVADGGAQDLIALTSGDIKLPNGGSR